MQTITLQIPEDLYARIQQRADRARRSVEAEFIDVLASAVPGKEQFPPELREAVASLEKLDDAELWRCASRRLRAGVASELQSLHFKRQEGTLTQTEQDRAEQLCLEYDREMLVRAHAALLLKERGHDVSSLLETP